MPNEPDWDGVDKTNLSYIAQGLFTSFLTEKIGGQTTAGFAEFNSPSCILLDTPDDKRVFTSGETVSADFLFAHYGDAALKDAVLEWSLDISGDFSNEGERGVGHAANVSNLSIGYIAIGPARKVATVPMTFPEVSKPVKATLVVEVSGRAVSARPPKVVRGHWDFWLFPKRAKRDGRDIVAFGACQKAVEAAYDGVLPPERAAEAKVVVADMSSPEVSAALARGQSVVEIGGLKEPANIELGWWFHKNIVGAVFETESPLLRYLPKSECLSTLHFRIFKKGLAMPVRDFPPDSLSVVSEEQSMCRAHLGERIDEKGARHVFAYGLALDQPYPEATAILDGCIDRARERHHRWVGGNPFKP
jgi:hypothetical protein